MEATTTATLRIGVLGVGRIGRMHAELLTARCRARRSPASTTQPGRARAAAAEPAYGPRPSTSCSAADVDAVAICSTTETHAD